MNVLSRNRLRNDCFQEKGSEMDSDMSSCGCFLLGLLFLVQKTAPARGVVKEPPGTLIVSSLRLGLGGAFFRSFSNQQIPRKAPTWSERRSKNTLLHNTRDLDFCCYLLHFVATEPPRQPKRCSRTAPKDQHLFEPQKVTL